MNQKKSKKILIICIVIVMLIILIGGFAFAFVATDIFKSKKELFFKYATQAFEKEDGFIDKSVLQYFEKQQSTPYEDEGTLDVEILNDSLGNKLDKINDFNISFAGKVDTANSKSEQSISVNYSEDVNLPFYYRKNGNKMGIQTKYVGSKYVAIRNDDIEDILDKFNMEEAPITNKDNLTFSEEELNQLKNTYINILNQQLKNENFTKITTSNATGYKLILKGQDLKNLLVKIIETMKTDDLLLNKLNEYATLQRNSTTIDQDDLDELINTINNNTEIEQNSIEIAVYQNEGKLNQISVQINDDAKLDIVKNMGADEVQYNVTATSYENNMESGNICFNAKYTGIQSAETVNESYEIGLKYADNGSTNENSLETEKENIKTLILDTKSNKMLQNSENSTITDEDIENILNSGSQKFYSKMELNKIDDTKFSITYSDTADKFVIDNTGNIVEEPEEKENKQDNNMLEYKYTYNNSVTFKDSVDIEELNEENSIILNDKDSEYVNNLMIAIIQRFQKVNKEQMEEIGLNENENPIMYLIPTLISKQTAIDPTINNELDEVAVNSFNEKFEMYASNNSKGATTKGLLSTILLNNTSGDSSSAKIKEINFDGQEYEVTEQNITLIKSNINVEDGYKVEFEKDAETGLIYRVVINKI